MAAAEHADETPAEQPEDARRTAFIEDDSTVEADWPGTSAIRGIRFIYKPMDALEGAAFDRELVRCKGDIGKMQTLTCKRLANQIVEWDVATAAGTPVDPGNWRNIARMADVAVTAIAQIIRAGSQSLEDAAGN